MTSLLQRLWFRRLLWTLITLITLWVLLAVVLSWTGQRRFAKMVSGLTMKVSVCLVFAMM